MWQSAVSQQLTLLSGKPCPQSSGSFTASYLVLFYTCSRTQHLWSICVIYKSQISLFCEAACVSISPCRFGCWRTDWAPGFHGFHPVQDCDKGKCEVRRGLKHSDSQLPCWWIEVNVWTPDRHKEASGFYEEHNLSIKQALSNSARLNLWHLTHKMVSV